MRAEYAVVCLFFIFGCCCLAPSAPPPSLNLTISDSPELGARVFIMDKNSAVIESQDAHEWFYPVQQGLPEGTAYGFRILRQDGSEFVPVNEKFTARKPPEIFREFGVQQYHGFPVGSYVVELVEIQGNRGVVRAIANLTLYTQESVAEDAGVLIRANCSEFITAAPYETRNAENASRLYDCARDLAVATRNPDVCLGLNNFFTSNMSMFLVGDCRMDYAIKAGNATLCDESSMPKEKGFCRAMVGNDSSECMRITCDFSCNIESFETQQDLCLQWYGIAKDDNSVCQMVKNEEYRNICSGLVLNDESICQRIQDEQSRANCFQHAKNGKR